MSTPVTPVDQDGRPVEATNSYFATATFTPAAAAYSANDVMNVAKTLTWTNRAGRVFPGGELTIVSTVFQVAETALQASEAGYNLQLYNVTPPSAHADNDAWDVPSGDRAAFIGKVALGTPVDLGSTLQVEVDNIQKQITVPSTGIIYAELVTAAGFTATATARKVTLHAVAW